MTSTDWIRVYKGNFEVSKHAIEFGWAKNVSYDRGTILDAFAHLEFLVNELIQAMITAGDAGKAEMFGGIVGKCRSLFKAEIP